MDWAERIYEASRPALTVLMVYLTAAAVALAVGRAHPGYERLHLHGGKLLAFMAVLGAVAAAALWLVLSRVTRWEETTGAQVVGFILLGFPLLGGLLVLGVLNGADRARAAGPAVQAVVVELGPAADNHRPFRLRLADGRPTVLHSSSRTLTLGERVTVKLDRAGRVAPKLVEDTGHSDVMVYVGTGLYTALALFCAAATYRTERS